MHEPEFDAHTIDENLAHELVGCCYLGNAALAIIGGPSEKPLVEAKAIGNSCYLSLDADARVKFLISAMAELEVMFREITDPGLFAPDVRSARNSGHS